MQMASSYSHHFFKQNFFGGILYALNPILYDGSTLRNIYDSFVTNELGFLIGACFYLVVANIAFKHRHNKVRLAKKRMVF